MSFTCMYVYNRVSLMSFTCVSVYNKVSLMSFTCMYVYNRGSLMSFTCMYVYHRGSLDSGFEALVSASQDSLSSITVIDCQNVLTDRYRNSYINYCHFVC